MDFLENWSVQVRKGILELCILGAMLEGEQYGYELVRSLSIIPGLACSEGTIYPLLSRLRVQGLVKTRLVESREGPARKYYAITDEGREMVVWMREVFDALVEAAHAFGPQEDGDE